MSRLKNYGRTKTVWKQIHLMRMANTQIPNQILPTSLPKAKEPMEQPEMASNPLAPARPSDSLTETNSIINSSHYQRDENGIATKDDPVDLTTESSEDEDDLEETIVQGMKTLNPVENEVMCNPNADRQAPLCSLPDKTQEKTETCTLNQRLVTNADEKTQTADGKNGSQLEISFMDHIRSTSNSDKFANTSIAFNSTTDESLARIDRTLIGTDLPPTGARIDRTLMGTSGSKKSTLMDNSLMEGDYTLVPSHGQFKGDKRYSLVKRSEKWKKELYRVYMTEDDINRLLKKNCITLVQGKLCYTEPGRLS